MIRVKHIRAQLCSTIAMNQSDFSQVAADSVPMNNCYECSQWNQNKKQQLKMSSSGLTSVG
ncbi:hypothetical protein CHS0354_010477, partial [Potamilus streckersoni]